MDRDLGEPTMRKKDFWSLVDFYARCTGAACLFVGVGYFFYRVVPPREHFVLGLILVGLASAAVATFTMYMEE